MHAGPSPCPSKSNHRIDWSPFPLLPAPTGEEGEKGRTGQPPPPLLQTPPPATGKKGGWLCLRPWLRLWGPAKRLHPDGGGGSKKPSPSPASCRCPMARPLHPDVCLSTHTGIRVHACAPKRAQVCKVSHRGAGWGCRQRKDRRSVATSSAEGPTGAHGREGSRSRDTVAAGGDHSRVLHTDTNCPGPGRARARCVPPSACA